jgi:electron transport complex protein RnfC
MIKRSFIGLKKPRLEYTKLQGSPPALKEIPTPDRITLLLETPLEKKNGQINSGDAVKTGQILSATKDVACVSPVTGTVSTVTDWPGDFGCRYTAVSVEVAETEMDETFGSISQNLSLEDAIRYLSSVPGKPPLKMFTDPVVEIKTIVITGIDKDLSITTNQYALNTDTDAVKEGINVLKKMTGVDSFILVVPSELAGKAQATDALVKTVGAGYPSANPSFIMQDIIQEVVPAGKTPEDLGYCFMSAESVASIGKSVQSGQITKRKIITVIRKDGKTSLVSAIIGTPISEIFKTCDITVKEKDRIVFGGPMTGSAVYCEDHPVLPDTDAIMVQDSGDLPLVSDYPCTNCGECVRICPAKVPVSMLVRFLEAGQYQEGADMYDLYSCIECGLCSFVCPARIPIFQYIRLAKYELDRVKSAEEANV